MTKTDSGHKAAFRPTRSLSAFAAAQEREIKREDAAKAYGLARAHARLAGDAEFPTFAEWVQA